MKDRFSDRIVLVTGGASGMGRAHAIAFAAEGGRVIVCDVDEAGGQAVASTITASGGSARFVALDVREESGWHALERSIAKIEGRLDILVHNAGGGSQAGFKDMDPTTFHRDFALNSSSSYFAAHILYPLMRGVAGANMIFIASIAAQKPTAAMFAYGASKAAICHMARTLAVDLAAEGIRVNAILPGLIDTPMTQTAKADPVFYEAILSGTPLGRAGEPEEVSAAVLFLASGAASFITGVALPVDGGGLAL